MAYDLEEQEQIATFKAFWNKYGNLITWVLILALGSFAAYNFWNSHTRTQSVEASALYDELTDAVTAKDNARSQRIAADIQAKFKRTAYAQMSALAAAKTAFDANDLKTAKAQLQWVLDNGNDEYKSVARLRLAGVLLDEKNFDGAMKLLDAEYLPQFRAEVADRKGDVLVAQNKIVDARAAYVAALAAMGPRHPGSQLVRIKLEAIGGTAPAAPASPAAPQAAAA
jgi:predicted negative regulator of RcsB-dependent stress response